MHRRTFESLNAFSTIVERGSFVRAAAHLGITPSALSQTIRSLEEELGVTLLHRTTRSLAPTTAGEKLLGRLVPMLRELDVAVAETTANRTDGKLEGRVRISTSKVASEIVIGPRLGRFLSTYPAVVLELVTDERLVDIVAERFDAGIRLGEQVLRDMIAVPVGGRQRLIVVGTPRYFARHGRPRQPKDLLAHRCVVHFKSGGEAYRWELEKGGRERQVAVTGALFENDTRLAELAVLSGEVIGFAFEAQMAPHLASGTLETVLDDWCPSFPGFHLYYPSRRHVTPVLRAFIETMKRGQSADQVEPE
jgi:DNA-binding transcriptional LysR family regulator